VENSNRDATLYEIVRTELTAESIEQYWLANGGGIAMRIYPKGSDNVSSIEQDSKAVSVNYDTTAQQLTVDSTKPIDALYIIDVLGRVQPVVATLPARHLELPVNNLESGMYWLVTTIAQENITTQFIK
jgi:hypothetical protein